MVILKQGAPEKIVAEIEKKGKKKKKKANKNKLTVYEV